MKINPYQSIKLVFHVGDWIVQPHVNTLSSNGRTVLLEPKVMEVLVRLALHAGEVMSQDQLMKSVWPDTFVTQDSLKRCVFVLRKTLGDDAAHPHIIETIRKRGYRIVAPVLRHPTTGTESDMAPRVDTMFTEADQGSLLSFFLMIGSLLGLDGRDKDGRGNTWISRPNVQ
jgi:DNA-binding winged helix-turn-helix (wHTH) protein